MAGARGTVGPTAVTSPGPAATRCSSAPTRSPRPTRPTATTPCRCTARSTPRRPFLEVSNGFAGQASDGLTQLDADRRLTERFAQAAQGNLVQTARIDLGRDRSFELALGFGESRGAAVDTARSSLGGRFTSIEREYARGWHAYDARLEQPRRPKGVSPGRWGDLVEEYYLSANYVKAAEDKTFPGAVAAALASPWGQAVSAGDPDNTYFGSYREVFARDLYEAWSALLLAGDRRTARAMTRFLFERQQLPDGSMPRNSLTNGAPAPDSFGTQLDECSYPLIMALDVGLTGREFYEDHIRPAANFVISRGPAFGTERWEEQSGFSPSTIAAEIAGLLAASRIADRNGDGASAAVWRGVADEFQRRIKDWTVTSTGSLSPEPYFIRLSKSGDPNAAISYNLGNGGPTLDQREVIDAGFLELARLGVLSKRDPDLLRSLPVVDATIRRETDSGPGFLRYNGDGYGDRSSDGRPWAPHGAATAMSGRCSAGNAASGSSTPATWARPCAPRGHAQHVVRRRADPRAGVGAARSRAIALRERSDARLDRLRERQARGLRLGADLVGWAVRAADARRRRGQGARPAALHAAALRQAHPAGRPSSRSAHRRTIPRLRTASR